MKKVLFLALGVNFFCFSMHRIQKLTYSVFANFVRRQHTLALIKPHIFNKDIKWVEIIKIAENNNFKVKSMLRVDFDLELLKSFYFEHKDKPFFASEFAPTMITAPALALILQKKDSVKEWRRLIGDADPKKADIGTIRHKFGIDINQNAVHGSSTPEAAAREIELIFGLKNLD